MYPEDRVLVGVINRKRDFAAARDEHWYRIPHDRAPRSIDAEYVAFYLSRSFKEQNGGIHYYARRTGHELVRRRDLLPDEDNDRADKLYYKLQLGTVHVKTPPVLNPTRRPISFIYTTWDRFMAAQTVADLYSKADWFVERVARALHSVGIDPERRWEDEEPTCRMAGLRIRCARGIVTAVTAVTATTTEPVGTAMAAAATDSRANAQVESVGRIVRLPVDSENVDEGVTAVRAAVDALGGPAPVNISREG